MRRKPKIGLALSGGITRGFAHIGAIKVLQSHDIPIDYVAGTSIGSIIGALYCSGAQMDKIVEVIKHFKIKDFCDFSVSKKGFVLGKKIETLLNLFIKVKTFEELSIPLSIVAADLNTGEKVVFNKGDIIKPIRASISIPVIFTPVEYEGKVLVDGGIVDRLPTGVVKEMGADIIIGVDVGFMPKGDYKPKTMFDVLVKSIGTMEVQIFKSSINNCDVLVSPEVHDFNPFSLENIDDCIERGIIAMQENIHKVKELINRVARNKLYILNVYKNVRPLSFKR